MPQWQAIVLICVSFGSLIIALYCLFFMVPVKRFYERIRSLGGGMEGVRSYISGIRDEVQEQIRKLEETTSEEVGRSQQKAETAVHELTESRRELAGRMSGLREEVESLQARLERGEAELRKLSQSAETMGKRLQQMQDDFDALDVELRESVRQLVADSLSTLESTVLSALEAVQEEILYGVSEPPETPTSFSGAAKPRRRGTDYRPHAGSDKENIIAPLFSSRTREQEQATETGDEEEAPGEEGPEEEGSS
jgi:Sec-independent protein translocase protein TatA